MELFGHKDVALQLIIEKMSFQDRNSSILDFTSLSSHKKPVGQIKKNH